MKFHSALSAVLKFQLLLICNDTKLSINKTYTVFGGIAGIGAWSEFVASVCVHIDQGYRLSGGGKP